MAQAAILRAQVPLLAARPLPTSSGDVRLRESSPAAAIALHAGLMRGTPRIGVALWLASGAAACGSAWTLDLTLQVSSRRQAEFSDYPAQLVLVTDASSDAEVGGPEGYAYRVANLCSDSGEDFIVRMPLEGEDCSLLPRFVQAWLEPREDGAEAKCGQLDEPVPLVGLRRPPRETLYAEAVAFEDSSGCGDLERALTLKLDW